MADRIEDFTREFESAIAEHRVYKESLHIVTSASRHAARLGEALEQLAQSVGAMRSLSVADVRAFEQELSSFRPESDLDGLMEKARALLQVIEDGIVDGDASRLTLLIDEAASLSAPRARTRGSGQIHLPAPAKARCVECHDLIVGKKQAALNWYAITKVIRDHEREVHGVYTESLRDELSDGLTNLRAGQAVVVAGRYEIGGL